MQTTKAYTLSWLEYEQASDLPPGEANLLDAATAGLAKAYAPYSRFQVGAALLLANGEVLTAANCENAAYPMCLCAERSAIAAAGAMFPHIPIVGMAITVKSANQVVTRPAAPCGACRQVMAETEERLGQRMYILLKGEAGPVYRLSSARDLLPLYFDKTYL